MDELLDTECVVCGMTCRPRLSREWNARIIRSRPSGYGEFELTCEQTRRISVSMCADCANRAAKTYARVGQSLVAASAGLCLVFAAVATDRTVQLWAIGGALFAALFLIFMTIMTRRGDGPNPEVILHPHAMKRAEISLRTRCDGESISLDDPHKPSMWDPLE